MSAAGGRPGCGIALISCKCVGVTESRAFQYPPCPFTRTGNNVMDKVYPSRRNNTNERRARPETISIRSQRQLRGFNQVQNPMKQMLPQQKAKSWRRSGKFPYLWPRR